MPDKPSFFSPKISQILFVLIIILAVYFRFTGINWDQGHHLHPDERFLTMVTTAIQWPKTLNEYLDTDNSPLNPHNKGFGFFVYGTFPVFFTKIVAETLGKGDYGNLTLVGRTLSALFDTGTVILTFLITKELISTRKRKKEKSKSVHIGQFMIQTENIAPLSAMFIYACMVLPIQLSHFYAVDTYLVFFLSLSFFLLIKIINSKYYTFKNKLPIYITMLGVVFGLMLASKISAVLFIPIIILCFLHKLFISPGNKIYLLIGFFILTATTFLTFRISQPYLFAKTDIFSLTLNNKLIDNWKQLKSFDDVNGNFPPAVQWITTKPYLFPLKNYLFWGTGLPIGLISITAVIHYSIIIVQILLSLFKNNKYKKPEISFLVSLSVIWIILLFSYQGSQFIKALRYFYPIYPFLAITSGLFITHINSAIFKHYVKKLHQYNNLRLSILLLTTFILLVYPLSFVQIYSKPITRVSASEWIYQNIPPGSTISSEEWDDGLPLGVEGYLPQQYNGVQFPLYWKDNAEKWIYMNTLLNKTDYIILSSNRLYGSIMTVPAIYPVTFKYYQSLFDGSLGFEKIAEFTSRPHIPLPGIKICLTPPLARYGRIALESQECNQKGISFVDDYADETFTVYDHPKINIFKKVKNLDYFSYLFKN